MYGVVTNATIEQRAMNWHVPLADPIISSTAADGAGLIGINDVGGVVAKIVVVIAAVDRASAINGVIARATTGNVVALRVIEMVGASTALNAVVAGIAVEGVVTGLTEQGVVAGVAF